MSRSMAGEIPRCPFCNSVLEPPVEVEPRRLGDFSYGSCRCGAVYVCDITGHNLGAAMVEALNFACGDDWDLAWSLSPGEDFRDFLVEGYDHKRHRVFPVGRDLEGNRIKGVLTFIKVGRDVQEVKGGLVQERLASASAAASQAARRSVRAAGNKKRYSKKIIFEKVKARDLDSLVEMARIDPLVLRKIQRLLYSADFNIRWNAVLMLGGVAGVLAPQEPGLVGDLVRRLLYSANDSAATNWGAIETVGEIIRHQPVTYGSFVRHVLGLLADPPSRPAVLWAVGRIGGKHPRVVKNSSFFVLFDLLESDDPVVRGHAAWALGQMGASEAVEALKRLTRDDSIIEIFDGQEIREVAVGELASSAVAAMEGRSLTQETQEEKPVSMNHDKKGPQPEKREVLDARHKYQEADILKNRGQSLDAMALFEEVLEVFDREGLFVEVANTCEKLGDLHVMRGNFKACIAPYQRALAICEKEKDSISSVILLEKIIDIYRRLEEWDTALPYYFRALELVEGLRDATRSAYFLAGIGDVYERKGRLDDALDAYRLSERLYRGMGSRERADTLKKGIEILEGHLSAGLKG